MENLKSTYITMRNKEKIDNNFLWKYYKEQGGKLDNPQEFINHFYTIETPIIIHGQNLGSQRQNRDLSNFFSDMDGKFELTTLWSADGKFLKVVE
jgi:hypothetical protein